MHIHLVAFDIPYPANYGGVIDVFYKIKALSELGIKIHLHAFEYHRPQAPILYEYCEQVWYYPRKSILRSLPVKYPHIITSRASNQLLENLLEDDYPIFFEGLHTTYFLGHPELENRKKWVRMHNIEWEYYYLLSQKENRVFRKQYLNAESRLLKDWEAILKYASKIFTISPKDTEYYKESHQDKTVYIPAFHENEEVGSKLGQGKYCLYHGNLEVPENHEAAMFLIYEVLQYLPDIQFYIAGNSPMPDLISASSQFRNVFLRPNPSMQEMEDLMRYAHIHVLPTFQSTGIKLKLINSLFKGRFVMVNPFMVNQTGLEFNTIIATDGEEFRSKIREYWEVPFTEIEVAQRKASLNSQFNNFLNAQFLIQQLKS
ncbi:MAG: glycosyltransferase [Bacteroidia bacterium]|nr:glycosyltransferase [Bacteroidia bacterium]